jgi:hypothetical protein
MIRPMKYHRIDIQSKVFDGATCIPTLYRLLKNSANSTRTVENNHFSHGFPFSTHQTLTVDEWKAQNIFSGTISEDILGLLTMNMVH